MGTIKYIRIYVDPGVPPKFVRLGHYLLLCEKKELQCLENQHIITPIKYSKWAAPIVPIRKHGKKSVGIFGNCKLTAGWNIT